MNNYMEQRFFCKAQTSLASHQIPHIIWPPTFITDLTQARNLTLYWGTTFQSSPTLTISLMLHSPLRQNFKSYLFLSGFPIEILYAPALPLYVLRASPIVRTRLSSTNVYRGRPFAKTALNIVEVPNQHIGEEMLFMWRRMGENG